MIDEAEYMKAQKTPIQDWTDQEKKAYPNLYAFLEKKSLWSIK